MRHVQPHQGEHFPSAASPKASCSYQPLASVWYGSDVELLEKMLDFYPRKRPKVILDATLNSGRFWEGSARRVVGMDIDPKHRPDVVADNRQMPFKDRCFDVVVYDPPHIPNQGRDCRKDFNICFGLVLKSPAGKGYNFSHLYPPFVREAHRVCRAGVPDYREAICPYRTAEPKFARA